MSTDNNSKEGQYHILVDQKQYWVEQPLITGHEIKTLAGVKPEYALYQQVQGPGDDIPIDDGHQVDISKPGSEHFFSGVATTTEGLSFLPQSDRDYLQTKGLAYEEVSEGDTKGIVIKELPLPTGRYDHDKADVLIILPAGYNDAPPDMFYLHPWVKLLPENQYANRADVKHLMQGITWQRWSRHTPANQWRPGIDGLPTVLARVLRALQEAKV